MSAEPQNLIVSRMAETLIGSEIIKLAGEINEKIKKGEQIYNLTIGDFDPKIFPIPKELEEGIIKAYRNKETNYPPANGIAELRKSVSDFLKEREGLEYTPDEILIGAGARPLIYATYQTLVEPRETVLFPVPSWNNNHYAHLSHANKIEISAKPDNNFMPAAGDIEPHLSGVSYISLCSPQNPAGTAFSKSELENICSLIVSENRKRAEKRKKPLYLLYDQIYWMLTFGGTKHFDPVSLNPEMRNYTVFIDGMSKSFAATGVRVGWAFGPRRVIDKMKSILSHLGAWAPKAEQAAAAEYLSDSEKVDAFLSTFKSDISKRLDAFYAGFISLKNEGFRVDAIAPQATIYLTVQFDLHSMTKPDGSKINNTRDITKYILEEARTAIVPFYAFGDSEDSSWFRLSVGACRLEDAEKVISNLRTSLLKLK